MTDLGRLLTLPWQSWTYNDEGLLREILRQRPSASWANICVLFNGTSLESRWRFIDSIISKGKLIQRQWN